MTVYVVQELRYKNELGDLVPKYNLEPATKFGELKFIAQHNANQFAAQEALELMRDKMYEFQEGDSLLLIGSPIFIGLATMIAAEYVNEFYFLQWSPRHKNYTQIKLNVNNFMEDYNE